MVVCCLCIVKSPSQVKYGCLLKGSREALGWERVVAPLGRDAAQDAAECVTYALEQLVHISEDEHALVDGLRARAAPCSEGVSFGFGECTTNQRFRARARTTTTSSSSLSMAHLAE